MIQIFYISENISDLNKVIDGICFLSCVIMGLNKFFGIYQKRNRVDKLLRGIQRASEIGPIEKFHKCDKIADTLAYTFALLIACTLMSFNASPIVLSYLRFCDSNTTFYEEIWDFPFTIAYVFCVDIYFI